MSLLSSRTKKKWILGLSLKRSSWMSIMPSELEKEGEGVKKRERGRGSEEEGKEEGERIEGGEKDKGKEGGREGKKEER